MDTSVNDEQGIQRKVDPKSVETSSSSGMKISVSNVLTDNNSEVFCIRYSPDGQLIVVGCGDGHLRVYNASNGRHMYTWNTSARSVAPLPVTSLRFRPITADTKTKNIVLVAGSEGTVQHWHITSGRCLHSIEEEDNQVYAVDYRDDGKIFATAGRDSSVRVYDEATKSCINKMHGGNGSSTAGHSNRVFALKFHPNDPNIIVTGGWDNTVQIWDIREDHAIRRIYGPHVCGDAVDMDGDTVLTGSWRPDKQLQLWDFGTGKCIQTYQWPLGVTHQHCALYAAQFNKPRADLIGAGGSGSNEAKIFDRKTGKVLGSVSGLDRAVYSIDFSPDSTAAAFGTGDGNIYMLNLKRE